MPSGDESQIELGRRIGVGSVFNRRARLSPTFVKGVAPAHHRGDGPRFSMSGEQVRAAAAS